MMEGNSSSSKRRGRGRRGSAGLARLRQECHRFREEVACIRTLPRLQLRWPYLARLEIGNESSEDGSVWDAAEPERSDTLSIGRQTEGVDKACSDNVGESPPPKLASLHIDSDGSASDKNLGGSKDIERKPLEDAQIYEESDETAEICRGCEDGGEEAVGDMAKNYGDTMGPYDEVIENSHGIVEITRVSEDGRGEPVGCVARKNEDTIESQGPHVEINEKSYETLEIGCRCEDGEGGDTVGCVAINNEDTMNSQGHYDGTLQSKVGGQISDPLTALKETSNPSQNGSLRDLEMGQDSPKGQILNIVRTRSGVRIAATAHFTANPRYNSHDLSTDCDPNNFCTCQGEGFKLVGFHGSNVSDNGSRKEREVGSEQVPCSSFESHIYSPSQLNGYATVDERHQTPSQTSTPTGTNFLEVGGRAFDKSSRTLQAHPNMRLLSPLPLVTPNCGSDVDYEWDNVLEDTIGSNGPGFCMAQVHACHSLTEQNQNTLRNMNQNRFAPQRTSFLEDHRSPTLSTGDLSKTAVDHAQSMNVQNLNWFAEHGQQKQNTFFTEDSAEDQRLRPTFMSGFAEAATCPTSSFLPDDRNLLSPPRSEPHDGALRKQGGGCLGLITFSGMKNFTKLGGGSTRDSVMTAQVVKRIKQALERLGDIGNKEIGHRRSSVAINKERWTDARPPIFGFEAAHESSSGRSDLKRCSNPDRLWKSSENRKLESHFFSQRQRVEQILGHDQTQRQTQVETPSLDTIHETKSTPLDEPELYLQSVIAALDSQYKSDVNDSTSEISAATTRLHDNQLSRNLGQDDGTSIELPKAHVDAITLTKPGKASSCQVIKSCGVEQRILESTNAVRVDTLSEEKHPANDGNSISEIISHRQFTEEKPVAKVRPEDLPAFSVQITAPPGSVLQVEVGGQLTVSEAAEEANQRVLANSLMYPSASLSDQGKFKVQDGLRRSRSLQRRGLQTATLPDQERLVSPSSHGMDPLYAMNKVEGGQLTTRARRFSTQEDLSHSFEKTITSLVKEANQLQEEASLRGGAPGEQHGLGLPHKQSKVTGHKRQQDFVPGPRISEPFDYRDDCCEGQGRTESIDRRRNAGRKDAARDNENKVRPDQRPSILKSSVKAKSPDLKSSSCTNHHEEQAFGAAAAGLARDLNVLMKDRRSRQDLQVQAQNKRKVVWASPEACELGPPLTCKPWSSVSARQQGHPKHRVSSKQAPTQSNVLLGDATPSAAQGVFALRKTKDQQNGPCMKQSKGFKYAQPSQKRSLPKNSKIYDEVSASPFVASGGKQGPKGTGIKSKKPLSVQERARTEATKVLDYSASEIFDYNQFRQELKDLQAERVKLETLVQTIFTADDPVKQQDGKIGYVRARHLQKNPEVTTASGGRDLRLEDSDTRKGIATSPSKDSGKELIGSNLRLNVSPDRADHGVGPDDLLKSSSQLPKIEVNKKQIDIGDRRSLDCENRQNDCTIRKPVHRRNEKTQSANLNQGKTPKFTSTKLQGRRRTHDGARSTIKNHPQVRKTTDRGGAALKKETDVGKSSSPTGEAFDCDEYAAKDGPDKLQGHTKLPVVVGLGTDLRERDQNVGFNGKSESGKDLAADLGFSSTDILQEKFPNLSRVLAVEDSKPAMQSAYAASKLQVAKPDFFKEYLLQALDSSILLLQHCVTHSEELEDEAIVVGPNLSNMHLSAEPITIMTGRCLDSNSNELNCAEKLSAEGRKPIAVSDDVVLEVLEELSAEGRKPVAVSDDVVLEVLEKQSVPDLEREHVDKLDPDVQMLHNGEYHLKDVKMSYGKKSQPVIGPSERVLPLEQALESGHFLVENSEFETQKTAFHPSHEFKSKVSNSEKETSWSSSLQSVLEAFEEAQRSAALLMSSSLEVRKSKRRPPFSCSLEHSGKIPGAGNKKLRMEGMSRRKVKLRPLTLLEKAEKAEANELKLRLAHKNHLKSKQKSSRSADLVCGKDKFEGRLRKHSAGREQWKVPKLIYRIAEFGLKRRNEWNDSTEISRGRHETGWNANAKAAAQALISKVLNEELARNQRRHEMKHLKPVKQLEAGVRSERKDSVNLDTYASTIALISGRERPSVTKREIDKCRAVGDNSHSEMSTPLSTEKKANDRADYFTMSKDFLETENHVLDESTMVFKKASEHSASSGNVMNQDVRESIEHWLDTSGGFEFLDSYNEAGEVLIFEKHQCTKQTNASFSVMSGVSMKNLLVDKLGFPSSDMEAQRLSNSKATVSDRLDKEVQGDLVSTPSAAKGDALHFSLGTQNEVNSSQGNSRGNSKGNDSDQTVEGFPLQGPSRINSIYGDSNLHCAKDIRRLDGRTCPSHMDDYMSSSQSGISAVVTADQQTEDFLPCEEDNAGSVIEEKFTEEEELEIALLEIVLRTILKDDPPSETAACLTGSVSPSASKRRSIGSSGTPAIACASTPSSIPAASRRVTPRSKDDERLRDGVHQGVQILAPDFHPSDFSRQDHGVDSAKSSGEDWPEYKCLAERLCGSQSSEDEEHWPEHNGVNMQEDGPDFEQRRHIEEFPSAQISTSSTNEAETDEKPPGGTIPAQAVAVSTRPPYSAVHSMRAAERQPIDFLGIASLAFGYPRPRPPRAKPVDQTSVEKSSVSVQTADMSIAQSPPQSTSVFVAPFYYLSPNTVYPAHPASPASEVPHLANTALGQHGPQFMASPYAATPLGVVPMFPPLYMFPPTFAPFPQGAGQTIDPPVAPVALDSQSTPITVHKPLVPPSFSRPSTAEGPSQPSATVQLAPTSVRVTSAQLGKLRVDVSEQANQLNCIGDKEDSPSSLDPYRSSVATPSTILSSPQHEARVASALAPTRTARGVASQVFVEGSSDEADDCGGVCQSKLVGDVQPNDQESFLPPHSMVVTREEDPLLESIIAENSYKQSRIEIGSSLPSLPTRMAPPYEFILGQHGGRTREKHKPGGNESVDSARSSVVVASYDVSGSSERSVKRARGKGRTKSSAESSLDRFFQSKDMTNSWSSRETLDPNEMSSHGLDGNQKNRRWHFTSQTSPLSEGEVELGQLPSEGEYVGPFHSAWGSHPRLLVSRPTEGEDVTSEPGEICKQAFVQLRLSRSEIGGCGSSISNSLSEGELRVDTRIEPGEVTTTNNLQRRV